MKKLLIISVAINCLVVLFFVAKRYYYSYGAGAVPAEQKNTSYDQWNYSRTSLLNTLPLDTTDIIFIGNSLTEGFPVTELFGKHVKNRGISGNATWHLLGRIEKIAVGQPKKIFIEIGVNDFNFGSSVDSAFDNYRAIISIIRNVSPRTRIYVQSLTPTGMKYKKILDSIITLNERLRTYCIEQAIAYIDLYTPLAKESQLDSAYTEDGIHLNGKGYAVWGNQVKRFIIN